MNDMRQWYRPEGTPAPVISLFNYKGGADSTGTTFNLGWMLAEKGLKVLMVDADPQCTLTGTALGMQGYDDLAGFYDENPDSNIYDILAGSFGLANSRGGEAAVNLQNGINVSGTNHENLKMIAGHARFSELDLQLAVAVTNSTVSPLLEPAIASVNTMIRSTAEKSAFDIVLVDTGPGVSATNRCILMGCDYFILPSSPDIFSCQAIGSLGDIIPRWKEQIAPCKNGKTLPGAYPRLLGLVTQNYSIYDTGSNSGEVSKEYEKWTGRIQQITDENLIPALAQAGMVISQQQFKKYCPGQHSYSIIGMQDFSSLVPAARSCSKPFFALEKQDLSQEGSVRDNSDASIRKAYEIYTSFADSVAGLIAFEEGQGGSSAGAYTS